MTKPRITLLILLTAVAGFCLGSPGSFDVPRLLHTAVGIGLLSAGIATLNQYLERELDGRMRRTQSRPLPSHRVTPGRALVFGIILSALAEVYLALLINPLTAVLGLVAFILYLFLYTPLKTKTPLCTAVGAIPGAMPPLMGWTAARGELGVEAWVLFSILFLWQFPHFLSIAWLYRKDYQRAGIRMLPVVEPEGKGTRQQIVTVTSMLVPVSLLPTLLGVSGSVYFCGALVLGLAFFYLGVRAAARMTGDGPFNCEMRNAKGERTLKETSSSNPQFAIRHPQFLAGPRLLLLASVLYLPLLFGLMVLNH